MFKILIPVVILITTGMYGVIERALACETSAPKIGLYNCVSMLRRNMQELVNISLLPSVSSDGYW